MKYSWNLGIISIELYNFRMWNLKVGLIIRPEVLPIGNITSAKELGNIDVRFRKMQQLTQVDCKSCDPRFTFYQ